MWLQLCDLLSCEKQNIFKFNLIDVQSSFIYCTTHCLVLTFFKAVMCQQKHGKGIYENIERSTASAVSTSSIHIQTWTPRYRYRRISAEIVILLYRLFDTPNLLHVFQYLNSASAGPLYSSPETLLGAFWSGEGKTKFINFNIVGNTGVYLGGWTQIYNQGLQKFW